MRTRHLPRPALLLAAGLLLAGCSNTMQPDAATAVAPTAAASAVAPVVRAPAPVRHPDWTLPCQLWAKGGLSRLYAGQAAVTIDPNGKLAWAIANWANARGAQLTVDEGRVNALCTRPR